MKLFISSEDGSIHTSEKICIKGFSEYSNSIEEIRTDVINNKEESFQIDSLLLFTNTHITNVWHLMHHLIFLYKYLEKNGSANIFPIFFAGFYKRQGDITKCIYNELIFKGMGLEYDVFLKLYNTFKDNKCVEVNNLRIIDTDMEFQDESLFQRFRSYILKNMDIRYDNIKRRTITFILRRGTREIMNIQEVNDFFADMNIRYIFLEDYSIKEQIEVVANTDILIGLHGAGLTWVVFMKKGSLLIEIYPGTSSSQNYIKLCKIANIDYKRVKSKIVTGDLANFRSSNVVLLPAQLKEIKHIIFYR